jgi:hypothetical protein
MRARMGTPVQALDEASAAAEADSAAEWAGAQE